MGILGRIFGRTETKIIEVMKNIKEFVDTGSNVVIAQLPPQHSPGH